MLRTPEEQLIHRLSTGERWKKGEVRIHNFRIQKTRAPAQLNVGYAVAPAEL